MYPDDYRYSKTHEWVSATGDLGKLGITDYAQSQLGDIVHIELPAVGDMVAFGEIFGSVDSVKAVSDLISPVSGEVVEVNEDLVESPELINEEPHTAGWMIIVKMSELSEIDELMDADQYEQYTERDA
jgi:glycine cleavage system H protein